MCWGLVLGALAAMTVGTARADWYDQGHRSPHWCEDRWWPDSYSWRAAPRERDREDREGRWVDVPDGIAWDLIPRGRRHRGADEGDEEAPRSHRRRSHAVHTAAAKPAPADSASHGWKVFEGDPGEVGVVHEHHHHHDEHGHDDHDHDDHDHDHHDHDDHDHDDHDHDDHDHDHAPAAKK